MTDKPFLLDTFCCAGGCTRGYQQAGFYVVGIDINPQKNYIGDDFVQMDAMEALRILIGGGCITGRTERRYWLNDFAVIHASPPCQAYSEMTAKKYRGNHPDLIAPVRKLLQATGKLYVIENVENARRFLVNPAMLCGSMFGLRIWRHRYFEIWPPMFLLTHPCDHSFEPVLISGTTRRKPENGGRFEYTAQQCRDASGLDWMTRNEMDEAIPPVFTQWIGQRLIEILRISQ